MESDDHYGPALPPGMVVASDSASSSAESKSTKSSRHVLGPALPPGMQKSSDSEELSDEGALQVKMDPEMSPEYSIQEEQEESDKQDDEEAVGPMPSEMSEEVGVSVTEEFERRSKKMKDQLTTVKAEAEEGPSKREEWMTELPPDMSKNFGLQNRQFSNKSAGGVEDKDRSSWTDTPGMKKEKHRDLKCMCEGCARVECGTCVYCRNMVRYGGPGTLKKRCVERTCVGGDKGKKRKRDEDKASSARDQQLQNQVEEYNKSKRPESLMDMHAKKQKKKKKKEKKAKKRRKEKGEKEEKPARRPFDREQDLQVNRFDDAQRQNIIKKSQVLNTRFSHGATTSRFL